MSILTDLLLLRFLNNLKGGKIAILLATIYLFFIFRSSIIAEVVLVCVIVGFLVLCALVMEKNANEDKKINTTDMTAAEKAYMANWRKEQEAKRERKRENPYD
jgi:Ca2+/Na+ antiporter